MSFEEIFSKQYYYYGVDENSEYIPQKKIFNLLRDFKVLKGLESKGIRVPIVSEPTFRKRVKELIYDGKIKPKIIRNTKLVHISDISTIMYYIIEKHEDLIENPRANNEDYRDIISCFAETYVDKVKKDITKTRLLAEKAKHGNDDAIDLLKTEFHCKVYTDDEIKKYEEELNSKKDHTS